MSTCSYCFSTALHICEELEYLPCYYGYFAMRLREHASTQLYDALTPANHIASHCTCPDSLTVPKWSFVRISIMPPFEQSFPQRECSKLHMMLLAHATYLRPGHHVTERGLWIQLTHLKMASATGRGHGR